MSEPTEEEIVRTALREQLGDAVSPRPPESAAELRARSGRPSLRLPDTKLVVAVAAALILVVALFTAGALHHSSDQPTPVHHTGGDAFSVRPLLCYAAPYQGPTTDGTTAQVLPGCSSASSLNALAIGVGVGGSSLAGYSSNLAGIPVDDTFAAYPSTPPAQALPASTVLLDGTPGSGPDRYVLGPAGLTGGDVASASARQVAGQWLVELVLTPQGATRWDALASQQFHALVGIVVNDRVVSAPITQPTQSSFTPFDGQLEIGGSFDHAQATAAASAIVGSK